MMGLFSRTTALALVTLAVFTAPACTDAARTPAAPGTSTLNNESFFLDGGTAEDDNGRWWRPGADRVFPPRLRYDNAAGAVTTLNTSGPTSVLGHPFFTPLGDNGRACVTCHQPADGMSLSVATIRERWDTTLGKDPLFAAIDGSNCPSLPQARASSHSLLLERGLFRIARPWPPRGADGSQIEPEFTIEVVRDPTGCNQHRTYGLHGTQAMVSVFRRPRPATNLKYVTAVGFSFDPKSGLPMPTDPETGVQTSGNVLSDVRAGTLKAQALDALRTHLELHGDPDPAQLSALLRFEQGLYTAQSSHTVVGDLASGGALGGPDTLATASPGVLQSSANPIWSEFSAWKPRVDGGVSAADASRPAMSADAAPPSQSGARDAGPELPVTDAVRAQRESIARGAALFSTRQFLVSDSTGLTDIGFGNPVRNSCAFCHNMQRVGMDVAPGQVDIGTANEPSASDNAERPQRDLPLFRLTCRPGKRAHPHLGPVVYTHDPGYALSTGRCIDIGKITAQQMRGLSARAPYFSQGNAQTLGELVDFYDRRYQIELTDDEKRDLTHFLEVL